MEDKRQLELIGITYNQIQSGVYALVLREVGTKRCMAIDIGAAEAQSIKCKMQDIITPRPLTHDLMVNMMRAFGIQIQRIFIRQLQDGVYAADIYINDISRSIVMDSRSSDAIALAVRMGVPIYTSADLLDRVGFSPRRIVREADRREELSSKIESAVAVEESHRSLNRFTDEQLNDMLQDAVAKELYEEAGRIKEELQRRKSNE